MKYTVKDADGDVISVFEADNLAEAVALKNQLVHDTFHGAFEKQLGPVRPHHPDEEIWTVAKSTRKEIREFKAVGFAMLLKKD